MSCGTCKHYEPERNPETGRLLPSLQGRCVYEVKWQDLPECFSVADLAGKSMIERPYRHGMWRFQGEHCKMWEQKKKNQRATNAQGNEPELDQNALFGWLA